MMILQPSVLRRFAMLLMSLACMVVYADQVTAASSVQQYTQDAWHKVLDKQGISLKNWGGMSNRLLSFSKLKKPRSRQAWLKLIRTRYPNIATRQLGNTIIVYLLPVGITQKHVEVVAAYDNHKNTDPFSGFDMKKLKSAKHIMQLPEIQALKQLASNEQKLGIYYERFVNPPKDVKSYYFTVEYVSKFKTMLPIVGKSSQQQQGMEGFASAYSVLSYVQANANKNWIQYKDPAGARYFKTGELGSPLFVVQQHQKGVSTIAMRTRMPNGTPFTYTIRKKTKTFTVTTKLESHAGFITLLDFAVLGGRP